MGKIILNVKKCIDNIFQVLKKTKLVTFL